MTECCTYPRCKCIVSTSTSQPVAICPQGLSQLEDQVFALRDGFYCRVEGKIFGPWPLHGYAVAGMQTEQRRAMRRKTGGGMEWPMQ